MQDSDCTYYTSLEDMQFQEAMETIYSVSSSLIDLKSDTITPLREARQALNTELEISWRGLSNELASKVNSLVTAAVIHGVNIGISAARGMEDVYSYGGTDDD